MRKITTMIIKPKLKYADGCNTVLSQEEKCVEIGKNARKSN